MNDPAMRPASAIESAQRERPSSYRCEPPAATRALERALARIAARAGELDRDRGSPPRTSPTSPPPAHSTPPRRWTRRRSAARARSGRRRRLDRAHPRRTPQRHRAPRRSPRPEPLRSDRAHPDQEGELLLGVWGADPAAGEGPPARLEHSRRAARAARRQDFCSGAGGVQRALVLAADQDGSRRLVYLDTTSRRQHRPRLVSSVRAALLGEPPRRVPRHARARAARRPRRALTRALLLPRRDPHLGHLGRARRLHRAPRPSPRSTPTRTDAVQAHVLGRMRVAQSTIDRWLEHTTTALDQPDDRRTELDPAGARRRMPRRALRTRAADLSRGGTGLRVAGADRREHPRPRPPRPRPVPAPAPAGPQDHQARRRTCSTTERA